MRDQVRFYLLLETAKSTAKIPRAEKGLPKRYCEFEISFKFFPYGYYLVKR